MPIPAAALVTVGTLDYRADAYLVGPPGNESSVNPMGILEIEVQGELAYVTTGEELRVIDVSDPTDPVELGALEIEPGYFAFGLAVDGGLAFAAVDDELRVIDVSNPANPTWIGSLDTDTQIWSIETANGVVYMNQAGDRISIVDVSNPQAPIEMGSIDTAGELFLLEIVDGRAYLYDKLAGILIFDISVPSAPIELGSFDVGAPAYRLAAIGEFAYVSTHEQLLVFDVSDPLSPVELGATDNNPYGISKLEVVNGIAYTMTYQGRLMIFDVSSPSAPSFIGLTQAPGLTFDFEVVGEYAFVGTARWGLQVIDVSRPTYPATYPRSIDEVATYPTSTDEATPAALGVAEKDGLAFVAEPSFLSIFDVSDPANPVRLSQADTGSWVYAVTVDGDFAYLLGYSSLEIFDVSNPLAPARAGSIDLSVTMETYVPEVQEFRVADGFAYALNYDGIVIIDVSDPTAPHEVGFLEVHAGGYEVVGKVAYIATTEGIAIIDISDPAIPVELGSLETSFAPDRDPLSPSYVSRPQDIAVVDSLAYLAQGHGGIRIVDVSDPTEPVEVGSFESFVSFAYFEPRRVEYRDGILLVVESGMNGANVWVFDLVDPLMPRPMGIVPIGDGSRIRNIAMGAEGVFYLATVGLGNTQLGLVVVDLGPEYRPGTATSDAFQCYGARSSRRPVSLGAPELHLHDTFGDGVERTGRARELCAPVAVDGIEIADATAHLACHDLAGPGFRERLRRYRQGLPLQARWKPFEVIVDNEFGDAQVLTVREPEQLCVASTLEHKASRVAPADPSGLLLDHFQCYGVEVPVDLPSFDPFEVSLSDTFGDVTRRVGDPTRLCAPVDVDGQGVINSGLHLTCYTVEGLDRRLRRQRTRVLASNRFGEEQLMTVRGAKTVCVPSDVDLP